MLAGEIILFTGYIRADGIMLPVIVPCLLRHISVNLFDDDHDDDHNDDDDENVWVTSLKI